MKWPIGIAAVLVLSGIAAAQLNLNNADDLVQFLMTSDFFPSVVLKQPGRTGDPAAVSITKYIAGRSLDAPTMDRILLIVHMSFESPANVERVADRDPRATMSLLQALDAQTTGASIKKRIADEKKFVLDQTAKLKSGPACLLGNFTEANAGPATADTVQMAKVYMLLSEPDRNTTSLALHRTGDKSAAFLEKLMGTCALDSDDTRRVLEVIRWSFEQPASNPARFVPNRTLVLLQNLETSNKDASVAADIAATRQYVLAQQAKSH